MATQPQKGTSPATTAAGNRTQTGQQKEAKPALSATARSKDLTKPVMFVQGNVKQLKDGDFTISSRELICLNYDDCILVLFYNDNQESTNLTTIWASAASQSAGTVFAGVHLSYEKKIAENFNKLNMDPNHPYFWARLQQMPFIIVYRRGWPVAFYNGNRSTQAIIDYSLTLACRAEYHEHDQKTWSSQAINNIEMSGTNNYEAKKQGGVTLPPRTLSEEYVTSKPMRGYANKVPTKQVEDNEIVEGYIKNPLVNTKPGAGPPQSTQQVPSGGTAAPIGGTGKNK